MGISSEAANHPADRGAVAILLVIFLPVFLALGVLIVDIVHLRNVRDNLAGSMENSASVASSAYSAYVAAKDKQAYSKAQTVAVNAMLAQGWPDFTSRGVSDATAKGSANNCEAITLTYTTQQVPTILAGALGAGQLTVSKEVTAIYHEYASGVDCTTNTSISPAPAPLGTYQDGRVEVLGLS